MYNVLASVTAFLPLAAPQVSDANSARVEPVAPSPVSSPATSVLYSEEHDGIWGAGHDYKVRAAEDGFTFFPFLGPDAERSWPVGFRLESARLGATFLELSDVADVSRTEDRIVLDRGAVEVTYDLALDSVEQNFTVDAAGAVEDLVLDLQLTTELAGRSDGPGLRFDGEVGGVRYGAAIVLDGSGRQADVAAALEGDRLKLTVPSEFLRTASGPIFVDPVLSTWSVDLREKQQTEPDVCYDPSMGQFMYVYETGFTAADTDIFFRTVGLNGQPGDEGYIHLGSDNTYDPSVACLSATSRCLCVFTHDVSGQRQVSGRQRRMDTGVMEAVLDIGVGPTVAENHSPDVGGSGLPLGRFLVIWTRGAVSLIRTVEPGGSLGVETSWDSGTADHFQVAPAVSKSTGEFGMAPHWNVAHVGEPRPGHDQYEISSRQIGTDGTLLGSTRVALAEAPGVAISGVDVSDTITPEGGLPTSMIVYTRREGSNLDTWLMTRRNNGTLFRFHVQALEHSRVESTQILPQVATTADDFVVTYLEQQPGTLNFGAFATIFDVVEDRPAISERRIFLGSTGAAFAGGCVVASRFASGLFTSRLLGFGLAAYQEVGGVTSWNIRGGTISATQPRAVGIQSQGCVGAPNSTGERGWILVQGDQTVDAPKDLVAGDLPPNALGLFIVGDQFATVPMAGGGEGTLCLGGNIGRFLSHVGSTGPNGTLGITVDPMALPTASGPAGAMAGSGRLFQVWHRDTGGGGQATFNFSNAALVIFR